MKPNELKWYTQTDYYDVETSELLPKSKVEREYIIKSKSISYDINNEKKIGTKKYQIGCEKNRQQRLFD